MIKLNKKKYEFSAEKIRTQDSNSRIFGHASSTNFSRLKNSDRKTTILYDNSFKGCPDSHKSIILALEKKNIEKEKLENKIIDICDGLSDFYFDLKNMINLESVIKNVCPLILI